ncbi:MAG TPA: DUF2339 domain-containing protein [Abditibacteriaceae bacterium]
MSESVSPGSEQPPSSQQAPNWQSLQELQREMAWLQKRIEQIEQRLNLQANVAQPAPPETLDREKIVPPLPQPVPVAPKPQMSAPPQPKPAVQPLLEPKVEEVRLTQASGLGEATRSVTPVNQATAESKEAPATITNVAVEETTNVNDGIDWENLIGGKWALWVGSFSLFLAVASFMALTWRYFPPPPPWAKIAMGLGGGLTMIVAGGYWRQRTQRWFSEGLFGAGLAICYLSLWAGVQPNFSVLSRETGFGAMAALTALGVYLSVRYDAVSLIVLSTIGGFLTPVLLRSSGNDSSSLALLIYVAVLDSGIVAVSLFRRWNGIKWLSFIATLLLLLAWSDGVDFDAVRVPVFGFWTLYFVLFLGAACFHSLRKQEKTADSDLILLFAASSVYALSGHALLAPLMGKFPSLFPLGMALFFALLGLTVRAKAPQNQPLQWSAHGLALLALTVAVPIQLQQSWLAIGWTVEAGILLLLSRRLKSELLQRAGQIVAVLSLWPLCIALWQAPPASSSILLNIRALPLLASVLMAWVVALDEHFSDKSWRDDFAGLYASFAVTGGAWLLAQESYFYFVRQSANQTPPQTQFFISIVLALYSLAIFAVGLKWRHSTVRLNALMIALIAGALPLWMGFTRDVPQWAPFWNWRLASFGVVTLVWLMLGWLLRGEKQLIGENEEQAFSFWPAWAAVLALTGVSLEVYFGHAFHHAPGDLQWQAKAFFALVMLWSVGATLLAWMGGVWRDESLRVVAYLLGAGAMMTLLFEAAFSGLATAPLLNIRFGAFAFLCLSFLLLSNFMQGENKLKEWESGLPAQFTLAASLLALWALTQETFESCRFYKTIFGAHWQSVAWFAIAILWQCGALMLLLAGLKKCQTFWRGAAYLLGLAGGAALMVSAMLAMRFDWTPFFNARALAYAITFAVWLYGAIAMQKQRRVLDEAGEAAWIRPLGLFAVTILGIGLTQETFETCYFFRDDLGQHWDLWAQMAISLVWSLLGALLLIGGIAKSYQPLRLAALGLLSVTVCKVFLFDLSFLEGALRILSLAGLGISLIFISWMYGRFGGQAAFSKQKGASPVS